MAELHDVFSSEFISAGVQCLREKFPGCGNGKIFYGLAPGRIEILGNHTDYNEGVILSAAIDKHTVLFGSPTSNNEVKLYTETFDSMVFFTIGNEEKYSAESGFSWANYPKGVLNELKCPTGFVGVFKSSIPVGGGVSSSAAIELATAMFVRAAFPESIEGDTMSIIWKCKNAENAFVGMGCGVLDQFTSAMGRAGNLIFLDCRDVSKYSYVPFSNDVKFVVVNSSAPHQLVDGKYNTLRSECFEAASLLGIPFLRDITQERFTQESVKLPENLRKRASHIVGENDRVWRGMEALEQNNLAMFGELMLRSHSSSTNDFGNSCRELDILVECARSLPGFLGGRLMGGGFGGCTINLVRSSDVEEFRSQLKEAYRSKTGINAQTFVVAAADGATGGEVSL